MALAGAIPASLLFGAGYGSDNVTIGLARIPAQHESSEFQRALQLRNSRPHCTVSSHAATADGKHPELTAAKDGLVARLNYTPSLSA